MAAAVLLEQLFKTKGAEAAIQGLRAANPASRRGLLAQTMGFACFYSLCPAIKELGLEEALPPARKAAYLLWRRKSDRNAPRPEPAPLLAAARWMLQARNEDGLSEEFDDLLDTAALLLGEKGEGLPEISELLFMREEKGAYNHELARALFAGNNPQALKLLGQAKERAGQNNKSAALAASLLGGAPADPPAFSRWLAENQPYIYFTGEAFQYSAEPACCQVDWERKYLNRPEPGHRPVPLTPRPGEEEAFAAFRALPAEQKQALAEHSATLRKQSQQRWSRWLATDVSAQLGTLGQTRPF